MTGQSGPAVSPGQPGTSEWRSAVPELTIAAGLVAAAGAAGYALAGPAAMAVVVIVAAAAGCAILPRLVPPAEPAPFLDTAEPGPALGSSFASSSDYWRKRARVAEGMQSMAAYNAGLRLTLEHLLASRLAERHGISLYEDPAAAHRLLGTDGRDGDLWRWIDPADRPAAAADPGEPGQHGELGQHGEPGQRGEPGIPERTLIRLIDRLEHL
jgi:hypothetical protein